MKKLLSIMVCVPLMAACAPCTPCDENSKTSKGANQSNSANAMANYAQTENAYTVASNSELGNLRSSAGKKAGEMKLWNDKTVGPRLEKLMGAVEYARMKKFWNTEMPISKFGDYLMMTGCETNNCEYNKYVVFMDVAEGEINVIHFGKLISKEWKEFDEKDLPPSFTKALDEIKKAKIEHEYKERKASEKYSD